MDWVCDASNKAAFASAQALVMDQLRRHALSPTDLGLAEPIVKAAFGGFPAQGELWARLDWQGQQPTLSVRISERPVMPRRERLLVAADVWAADEWASSLAEAYTGPAVTVSVPVTRAPEVNLDLMPEQVRAAPGINAAQPAAGFLATVAVTMAGQVDAGSTMAEAAVVAGATAASAARQQFLTAHGGREPANAREVAEAFLAHHNAAGSDFFIVEAGERRAVLANRSCPFGAGVADRTVMCRTTSALLGSLAARAGGRATVALDEAIAVGDARCRLVLDLDAEASRWSHSYQWPPAGPGGQGKAALTRGFRVALSLRLPRDRLSVSLIRHMTAHALREVGTDPEDVSDVEVALTEAATNVIKHSGAGDAYDVEVTIGPSLVELRVIDVGRGFDSEAISLLTARPEAEQGRGVALMHALVDQARFISAPERGTIVHLIKRLRFDNDAPARRLMLSNLAEHDRPGTDG